MRTIQSCLFILGGILAGIIAPVVGIYWGNAESSTLGKVVAVAVTLSGLAVMALAGKLRPAETSNP